MPRILAKPYVEKNDLGLDRVRKRVLPFRHIQVKYKLGRKPMPRTKTWLKVRRPSAVVESLDLPFQEPQGPGPHQLSLPFPGLTVSAIRFAGL
jgi:hypothetical protein